MAAEVQVDLSERVYQATQLVSGPDADLAPHLDWVIGTLLDRVGPHDLNAQEKMAVAVVLAGAHSRKLAATGDQRHLIAGIVAGLLPPEGGRVPLRVVSD